MIGTATTPRARRASARRSPRSGGRGAVLDVAQQAVGRCADRRHRGARGCGRHPVQQRRDHPRHAAAAHEAGGLGRGDADQSRLGVPALQGGAARHDEGAHRAASSASPRSSGLTGNAGQANYAAAKAGIIGFTQVAGPRGRLARHHRERGRAGVHRHGHDPGAQRGAARRAERPGSARAARPAGGHRRGGRVPGVRRKRPTSPAKPCTSTAACTWPECGSRPSITGVCQGSVPGRHRSIARAR